jgi:hypothetical protein
MVYKYCKILETLDKCRKKRNEERERKRLEDPSGNISDDEPDNITPFLEHPDKDNNAEEYGQCSQTTPVSNESTTAQPKGEARSTHKATPKFNVEGTLFHDAEASQNKFETYNTSIPNNITLLAACDIAPPLPLFTTEALEHIRNRKNLKFVKVGTGQYENTRVLDVSDFPVDEDLSPTSWCLAYNTFLNWMSKRAQGKILEGWTMHHDAMVNNPEFQTHFQAYVSFDKEVCSRFFTNGPFIINPSDYRWSNALINKKIVFSTKVVTNNTPSQDNTICNRCYQPYDVPSRSFRSFPKPQFTPLCLRCGRKDGHQAPHCDASTPSRKERRWVVIYRNGNLTRISDNKPICTRFNIGTCSSTDQSHGLHVCSLCDDTYHAAVACTRN